MGFIALCNASTSEQIERAKDYEYSLLDLPEPLVYLGDYILEIEVSD